MNTYIIFGASGEIAMKYIQHLDDTGAEIAVLAFYNHNPELLSQLECKHIMLIPIKCDLSNKEETEEIFRQIKEKYNDITHFICFAYGKLKYDRVTAFSAYDIEKCFNIQISSCGIALAYLIPIMKKNKFGRVIIITSSVTIGSPPSFMSEYTIIKYASLGLIKSYAAECIRYNITVNGIAPSMVDTKLWNDISPIISEKSVSSHPLKRTVSFDEINHCIDFLSSKEAGFITGENINLSGGETV